MLIHAVSENGHRKPYLDLLGAMCGGEPIYGPLRGNVFLRLLQADRVLISTVDDDVMGFGLLTLKRSLRGLPTLGLFLRPQSCFGLSGPAVIKRLLFSLLKSLPKATVASITPFDVAPHYAKVSNIGLHDPQYWDLVLRKSLPNLSQTEFSRDIKRAAGDRMICTAIGALRSSKGIGFLAQMLEQHSFLHERTLWLFAGRVPEDDQVLLRKVEACGATIINRYLTDAEIESLYGISDAVWSCYAPEYDQASGIFGRAVQFGVPAIVRRHSLIHRFADQRKIPVIALEYGDPGTAATLAEALSSRKAIAPLSAEEILRWGNHFIEQIYNSLRISSDNSKYNL